MRACLTSRQIVSLPKSCEIYVIFGMMMMMRMMVMMMMVVVVMMMLMMMMVVVVMMMMLMMMIQPMTPDSGSRTGPPQ